MARAYGDIEHPQIIKTNRTGYPTKFDDVVAGFDYFGDEIWIGDKIYVLDDEMVLEGNLERYLVEVLGFEVKEAE
ncbi:YqaI family protein [Terrihalobacillus insolitus]|uniref:YqaI family protein n=1 Tax=Terrihalobacillus insolitus TaxID=2950438 RepID=UPI002340A430|nr:hypothetical protein [Terrihalobacillus insolitus]MDC3414299.1 hypothetical protein [Terrihalobacillus insolitus]